MKDANRLTPQMEAFAAGLATGTTRAEAYRQAYPKARRWKDTAVWVEASRLANDPRVSLRVSKLLHKAGFGNEITIERVQRERARLAFFDPAKLFDKDGHPLPIHDIDEDTRRVIQGIDVEALYSNDGDEKKRIGSVLKVRLADKSSSLTALEKCLGMYRDESASGNTFLNIHIDLR